MSPVSTDGYSGGGTRPKMSLIGSDGSGTRPKYTKFVRDNVGGGTRFSFILCLIGETPFHPPRCP